jgi:hypothetical protein
VARWARTVDGFKVSQVDKGAELAGVEARS